MYRVVAALCLMIATVAPGGQAGPTEDLFTVASICAANPPLGGGTECFDAIRAYCSGSLVCLCLEFDLGGEAEMVPEQGGRGGLEWAGLGASHFFIENGKPQTSGDTDVGMGAYSLYTAVDEQSRCLVA